MTDAPLTGRPCWVDLSCTDVATSAGFYGELFSWNFTNQGEEFGGYHMITHDGQAVAGAMTKQDPNMPEMWNVYLQSEDAKATQDLIIQAGGQIIVPAMQVSELGTMLVGIDPAGAAIGAWEKGTFEGFVGLGEIHHPIWFETMSKDYSASVAFYEKAFGWRSATLADESDFRYTTLGEGDAAAAGIMDAANFLPAEVPSYWQFYVRVDDADETLARAGQLGGTVLQPANDTPYGRLAQVADPTGAPFCIMQR